MNTTDSQVLPAPPRLISALVAGFDAIANHVWLILFPIGLDLFLWFGPHIRLKQIINSVVGEFTNLATAESPEISEMLNDSADLWTQIGEQFNLAAVLRSYPIGIPSLMVSSLPVKNPGGYPAMVEISSMGNVLLWVILFTVIGLIIGSLYFSMVAQAAVGGEVQWRRAIYEWPRNSIQTMLLTLVWVLLMIGVSLPASCMISIASLSGFSLGQFAILLYGGVLLWLIFPLLFSPHGIFINGHNVMKSIRHGIRITNMTILKTGLFFLTVLLITQGLDLLWRIPPEDSWLMMIGVAGHAFVATGLLSSSFIYYRDADRWVQSFEGSSEKPVTPADPSL